MARRSIRTGSSGVHVGGGGEVQSLGAGDSVEVDPDAEGIASPLPSPRFRPATTRYRPCWTWITVTTTWAVARRTRSARLSRCRTGRRRRQGDCAATDGTPRGECPTRCSLAKARAQVYPGAIQPEEFQSPLLTNFWGHPVSIRAWIVLPPGYSEHREDATQLCIGHTALVPL